MDDQFWISLCLNALDKSAGRVEISWYDLDASGDSCPECGCPLGSILSPKDNPVPFCDLLCFEIPRAASTLPEEVLVGYLPSSKAVKIPELWPSLWNRDRRSGRVLITSMTGRAQRHLPNTRYHPHSPWKRRGRAFRNCQQRLV